MKRRSFLSFFIITVVVVFFFFPLLYPKIHLLTTPDYGGSDSIGVSFSGKWLLGTALKKNTLPFWSSQIGNGFPVLSEGQSGALFPINLVLFRFFSVPTAYTVVLLFSLISFGWGIYVLSRLLSHSWLSSLVTGTIAAISGIAITQMTHIAILQGFSLLPWVLASGITCFWTPTPKKLALFSCLLGIQLLSGNPQPTILSLLFLFAFVFIYHSPWQKKIWSLLLLGGSTLLAGGLAAIQLIPSFYFLKLTTSPSGFDEGSATFFSYPWKHFLTMVDPFFLGNPKMGTYPAFYNFSGSIFWENTGYIGILPIILVGVYFLLFVRKRLQNQNTERTLIILFILSALLMLGKYSPLYFLFTFPPFSFFRVPSRFLWLFVTILLLFTASTLDFLIKKKLRVLVIAFVVITVFDLFSHFGSYHVYTPVETELTPPKAVSYLTKNAKVVTIGNAIPENNTMTSTGWQDREAFLGYRNFLSPNENVLYGVSQLGESAGRIRTRTYIGSLLVTPQLTTMDTEATLSARMMTFLARYGVTDIISSIPILFQTATPSGLKIIDHTAFLYHLNDTHPKAYLTRNVRVAKTTEDVNTLSFDSENSIVEETIPVASGSAAGTVTITKDTGDSLDIAIKSNETTSLLVVNQSYDQGWKGSLNGKNSTIIPVNVRNIGIVLPPGDSVVTLQYRPKGFFVGFLISFFSFVVVIAIFVTSHRRFLHFSHRKL